MRSYICSSVQRVMKDGFSALSPVHTNPGLSSEYPLLSLRHSLNRLNARKRKKIDISLERIKKIDLSFLIVFRLGLGARVFVLLFDVLSDFAFSDFSLLVVVCLNPKLVLSVHLPQHLGYFCPAV